MDALSEALSAVRMTGAIFFHAECSAPWGITIPDMRSIAHFLSPGTERLVGFHLMTQGHTLLRYTGAPDVTVASGEIIILPHGAPHTLTNGTPSRLENSARALEKAIAGELRQVRLGGGGEPAQLVCGFFGCERHADRLFLAGLPDIIKIDIRKDAAGEWLERSITHLLSEAGSERGGHTVLLSKMAEVLFIETLRRHMDEMPRDQTGWLAGAKDKIVGGALLLLHRKPSHPWTLDELAGEVGASRTVLTGRFARFLGESPLAYLARWRLQLAGRLLLTTHKPVLQVAYDVGYESEAAFNRAFKREFGVPPGRYRSDNEAS